MRFPLTIVDETGKILTAVNDIDQMVNYISEYDDGETYEVESLDDDRTLILFQGFNEAFQYNPVSFAMFHPFIIYEWPELMDTCPGCGCRDPEPYKGKGTKFLYTCPDCGTHYDPIDIDALFHGKLVRRA